MADLILVRGIPASGKSTWARAWVAEDPGHRIRLNRDDLRRSLFGQQGKLTYEQEQLISTVQQTTAREALRKDVSVVVDDTNLNAKFVRQWYRIGTVTFKDFDIALEVAIARDAGRDHPVGSAVVQGFYDRYLRANGGWIPAPPPQESATVKGGTYVPDKSKPTAYIFDIDNTLARIREDDPRSPYDGSRVHEDEVIEPVRAVLWALRKTGASTLITTGRDAAYQAVTERWLDDHFIEFDAMFMRPEGDRRKDHVVKLELFDRHIRHEYNVRGVFDDRLRVVRMWHQLGLPLFRVGDPDADF